MSVTVNLDKIMSERSISCSDLAKQIDIPAPDVSLLKTGKAKAVKFTTLDKLCKVFGCQIGDILVYSEDEQQD